MATYMAKQGQVPQRWHLIDATDQIVGRLNDLHEKVPGLAIIPAHGRSAYKKFFPGGPQSCVSNQYTR